MNYEPYGTFMEENFIKILQEIMLFNGLKTGTHC
jgi:hypothetical protein